MNEVGLHESNYDDPNSLKHLMPETWSSELLDYGVSKMMLRGIDDTIY